MLRWTVTFLIIAIVAAIFGFGGIAAGAASIAKVLFFIFLVLFVLSLVFGASIFKGDDKEYLESRSVNKTGIFIF